MAAYWEIAVHLACDMFSKYEYLIVNLVFPPQFLEWEFLSDCAFTWSLPTSKCKKPIFISVSISMPTTGMMKVEKYKVCLRKH